MSAIIKGELVNLIQHEDMSFEATMIPESHPEHPIHFAITAEQWHSVRFYKPVSLIVEVAA